MNDVIFYFACLHNGDWKEIYNSIVQKESVDENRLKEFKELHKEEFITILDEEYYPDCLRNIINPPFILFYKGDISLLKNQKLISIVGTRHPSTYGEQITEQFTLDFVNNDYVIVSGLAKGIDSIAHKTAINNNGKTIGIIAGGIDTIYPSCNANIYSKMDLIISEFPSGVEVTSDKFNFRNRIVAALGKGVLVTQAFSRSGTLITVRHALEQGRQIYAIPSNINDGCICNDLIKEGALSATNARDIIEDIENI